MQNAIDMFVHLNIYNVKHIEMPFHAYTLDKKVRDHHFQYNFFGHIKLVSVFKHFGICSNQLFGYHSIKS